MFFCLRYQLVGQFCLSTIYPERVMAFTYPKARRSDQVDTYHGIEIPDPYRWLEDSDSEESRAWIEGQNELTFGFLKKNPDRDRLKTRLTQLWNYEKYGIPFKEGDRYFYFKNDGLQNQNVLYVLDDLDGNPRVLLDPNQLSEDGTVALTGYAISPDGHWLAYSLSESGSDWKTWRIRNIDSGAGKLGGFATSTAATISATR